MRTAKILGLVVGGLIALVVIGLLAVWLLVSPNDFKPKIAAAVKNSTGRELALTGDIKLSVFPWIALQLGPASLGNPAGFSQQPFVSFNHAAVRVKLLPLLSKRLEVGRVELDGLDLKLLKNAEGKGNWEGFGKADQQAPTPEATAKPGETLQGIEAIKITNARVNYQQIVIQNINLETGSFADKGVVPVTLHLDADRGVAGEHASLDVRFDFSADAAAERYRLAALNLMSNINRAGEAQPLRVTVTAPGIDLDLKAQTLGAPAFAVDAAGAKVSGGVAGTKIIDALTMTGMVTLAPLTVREFLPRLGIALPATRDPKAFSLVSASTNFEYGNNAAHFDKVQATLDDTHLNGGFGMNLDTKAVTFDLTVDKIDADRYLPPETQVTTAKAPPPPAAKPGEPSTPLNANGSLSVGSVHMAPLDLTNVKVTVASKDQVMHVFPLKAQVFGGQYSGDITLDSRSSLPALSMDEHLTGVDMGKLVAAESKNLHVTGRGNVDIKATAHGAGADAIMKTLTGHFDTNVADGAVEGIDMGYVLAQAQALIQHQNLASVPNTKRTKFDALKMSAEINNGVATTKDLTIASAVLKITGQGSANLPTKGLDFALVANTPKSAGNLQIPVKVTGTMADPTVRPDVEALAKGQLKQKVQDVVQDKLKGLFGK